MKGIKKTVKESIHGRGVRKIILFRLLSSFFFVSGSAVGLVGVLSLILTPAEIIPLLPGLGFVRGKMSAAVFICILFFIVYILFCIAFFAVRFSLQCEIMYVERSGLTPPENTLTLKNGVRFAAFCILRFLMRLRDGLCCFLPSFAAFFVVAYGLFCGTDKKNAVVAFSAYGCMLVLGVLFFVRTGAGRTNGVCTLYLGPLSSPLTAARESRRFVGRFNKSLHVELSLLPYRLLSLLPIIGFYGRLFVKKCHGILAVKEMTEQKSLEL